MIKHSWIIAFASLLLFYPGCAPVDPPKKVEEPERPVRPPEVVKPDILKQRIERAIDNVRQRQLQTVTSWNNGQPRSSTRPS